MATKKYKNPSHHFIGPGLILLAVITLLSAGDAPDGGQVAWRIGIGLAVLVFGILMARTAVNVTAIEITVRNLASTKVISWDRIQGFDNRISLVIELTDGSTVHCTAVQPTNVSRVKGRGYAQRVATDLTAELAARRGRHEG
ncbi:PH domain-containing protein [Kitasatospora sp. CB01950]|uniref:PH domain-containing protein n=1 Tax=Kitasatospora sp. CB01950 TaxID=1703930 RepID=UPI000938F176|nr:PH domain-containing protein [Kitasatospora sp. CB01950]OKI99110.1 hypothetical protein AMK19_31450 [Kitasatospora sp. CB01950]